MISWMLLEVLKVSRSSHHLLLTVNYRHLLMRLVIPLCSWVYHLQRLEHQWPTTISLVDIVGMAGMPVGVLHA